MEDFQCPDELLAVPHPWSTVNATPVGEVRRPPSGCWDIRIAGHMPVGEPHARQPHGVVKATHTVRRPAPSYSALLPPSVTSSSLETESQQAG